MKKFDLEEIKCIIAAKYHWGPPESWTNFHFKELSKAIGEVTGDRISEETLKRIFGKRKVSSENYQPQAYSQMALIKFVEHLNKRTGEEPENKALRKKSWRGIVLAVAGVAAIVLLVVQLISPGKKPASYRFSCENPTDFYPFTVTFNYDISEIEDSVFTDFGRGQETYLPPERSMINYFYSNTGVYQVRFYTRSVLLDSLRVIAYANNWQGGFFPNSKPELFQAFLDQSFYRQADHFFAPANLLKNNGIDLAQKYWTSYRYFSPFNKSMDALTLETQVFNNASTGSLSCYDIEITLVGDSGTINFKFTQPKCSRYASLRVSEKYLGGEFDNLGALSVDLSGWLQIKMATLNGHFSIALGNKEVFTEEYQRPLGNLLGIIYSFFGSGKIDYLILKDSQGEPFYENPFSLNDVTENRPK